MIKLTKKESELKGAFLFFLNANNALKKYNAELIKQHKTDAKDYFNVILKMNVKNKKDLLLSSFNWERSKYGQHYWSILNSKWEKQCDYKWFFM